MTFTKRQIRTGNDRLLYLAQFLRTLPRKKFNYDNWVGWDWEGKPDLSCGTSACALGWATTLPRFRRLGLRLNEKSFAVVNVKTGIKRSISVAMDTFFLTEEEANYLFIPQDGEQYVFPKYVAEKFENFVNMNMRKTGVPSDE